MLAEFGSFLLLQSVGFLGLFGFAVQIYDSGNFHLHAVGEFIVFHARLQFIMVRMLGDVATVEESEFIKGLSLMLASLVGRAMQVEDRGSGWTKSRALELSRKEAVRPIPRATLGQSEFRHHDVAWEVSIDGAQPVVDPCPDRGIST